MPAALPFCPALTFISLTEMLLPPSVSWIPVASV